MGRTFQDSCRADARATTLNTNEFAVEVTITKPSGGAIAMTANQRLSLMGLPPIPDGAISAYDRLQLLGLYRIGEGGGGPVTATVAGQLNLDLEDEQQGLNLDDNFGRRHQKIGRFVTGIDEDITTDDLPSNCDTLTYAGETWQCVRVEGRDLMMGTKTIVIRRDEKITTKQGRPRS